MASSVRDIASSTSKATSGLREVIRDLVAPDLRALRVSVDALGQELRLRTEALSTEMKLRSDYLEKELHTQISGVREQIAGVREEIRLRDENQSRHMQLLSGDVKELSRKLDFTLELRKRVAVLEARLPKQ